MPYFRATLLNEAIRIALDQGCRKGNTDRRSRAFFAPAPLPSEQRALLLAVFCAGALASAPVFAQQTASGGQSVQITPGSVCTAQTCFTSTGAGSLLYSDPAAPIAFTVNPLSRFNSTTGVQALNLGTVRIDGNAEIRGTTALLADNGTIISNGSLNLQEDRQPTSSSPYLVVAQNSGTITLNGATSIGGPFVANGALVALGSGSTVTVNGPLAASVNNTALFAYAANGGYVNIAGGGTVELNGTLTNLAFFTADGKQAASRLDINNITARTISNNLNAIGVQTWDEGTVNVKNSSITLGGASTGTPPSGILLRSVTKANVGGTINIDNSQFAMTTTAGTVVRVEGTQGSTITLTNGSKLTAFNGASGNMMFVTSSLGNQNVVGTGADVTLHATDSTLVGQVSVDQPGSVSANHLAMILDGTSTWTGDLNVAAGSSATATVGGTAHWTGTSSGTSGIDVVMQDSGIWTVTAQPSGLDNLTFNGGTVQADVDALAFSSPITVGAGGGTFDTQRYSMAVSGVLSGSGSLTKTGSGTLTQTGNSGGFSGNTAVNAGTLLVNGTLGGTVNVASGGALGGYGTVGGDTNIASGGALIGRQGQILNFAGNLTLASGSNVNVSLGAPESTGLFNVAGDLTLAGKVNVTDLGGFSPGIYRIFDYTGSLTNNGITVGTVPSGIDPSALSVQTAPNQVNLVNTTGVTLNFWDGDDPAKHNNNVVDGGNGTWSMANTNWTEANGALDGRWSNDNFAVFMGQPGTVTVDSSSPISVAGMQFAVDGYRLEGGAIILNRPETIIRTGAGGPAGVNVTATIASELTGSGGLVKSDYGTLTLTGANTYQGGTVIREGTLQLGDGGTSGSIVGAVHNNATLAFNRSDTFTFDNVIDGSGALTQVGTGTTVLTAANTYTGTTTVKAGTLAVNGSITSATTVAAGGTLGGSGTIIGNVNNFGTISPGSPGNSFGTLTIAGNYTGHNGSYKVESALGGSASPSDRLVISGGTASGTTALSVTNLGGKGALTTGYGIPVVSVANGGTTTTTAFSLAAPAAAGPYEYMLYRGSDFGATGEDANNWYLSSVTPPSPTPTPTYRPESPVFAGAPAVARQLGRAMLGTFHDRVGDEAWLKGTGNDANTSGTPRAAWGRWIGQAQEMDLGGELKTRVNTNINGLQVGRDFYTRQSTWLGKGGEDRFGGFFTYGHARSEVHGFALGKQNLDAGRIDLDSYSLGATWTHFGASGWYLDGVVMGTRYNGDLQSNRGVKGSVNGYGLVTSLEAGYPIALAPNLRLEPQAQVIWQRITLDRTQDQFSDVAYNTGSTYAARAGVRLSSTLNVGSTVLKPFLTTNIWQESLAKDTTSFSGTELSSGGQSATSFQVVSGLSAQLTKNVGLWGNVSYLTDIAGPNQNGWSGNVGVRITW